MERAEQMGLLAQKERGMMTKGCAGRRELLFTSFPAQPESAPARACRPWIFPSNVRDKLMRRWGAS